MLLISESHASVITKVNKCYTEEFHDICFTWIDIFTVNVSEFVICSCDCESLTKKWIKYIAFSKSDQSNRVRV